MDRAPAAGSDLAAHEVQHLNHLVARSSHAVELLLKLPQRVPAAPFSTGLAWSSTLRPLPGRRRRSEVPVSTDLVLGPRQPLDCQQLWQDMVEENCAGKSRNFAQEGNGNSEQPCEGEVLRGKSQKLRPRRQRKNSAFYLCAVHACVRVYMYQIYFSFVGTFPLFVLYLSICLFIYVIYLLEAVRFSSVCLSLSPLLIADCPDC